MHAYQHMRVVTPWHKNQLVITFKSSITFLLQVKSISTTIEVVDDLVLPINVLLKINYCHQTYIILPLPTPPRLPPIPLVTLG